MAPKKKELVFACPICCEQLPVKYMKKCQRCDGFWCQTCLLSNWTKTFSNRCMGVIGNEPCTETKMFDLAEFLLEIEALQPSALRVMEEHFGHVYANELARKIPRFLDDFFFTNDARFRHGDLLRCDVGVKIKYENGVIKGWITNDAFPELGKVFPLKLFGQSSVDLFQNTVYGVPFHCIVPAYWQNPENFDTSRERATDVYFSSARSRWDLQLTRVIYFGLPPEIILRVYPEAKLSKENKMDGRKVISFYDYDGDERLVAMYIYLPNTRVNAPAEVEREEREIIDDSIRRCLNPNCDTYHMKISGCNQMWCSVCHLKFDWETGAEITGPFHNPMFFEHLNSTAPQAGIAHYSLTMKIDTYLMLLPDIHFTYASEQIGHLFKLNLLEFERLALERYRAIVAKSIFTNFIGEIRVIITNPKATLGAYKNALELLLVKCRRMMPLFKAPELYESLENEILVLRGMIANFGENCELAHDDRYLKMVYVSSCKEQVVGAEEYRIGSTCGIVATCGKGKFCFTISPEGAVVSRVADPFDESNEFVLEKMPNKQRFLSTQYRTIRNVGGESVGRGINSYVNESRGRRGNPLFTLHCECGAMEHFIIFLREAPASHGITSIKMRDDKVKCPLCEKEFKSRGLATHMRFCKK